MYLYRTNRAYRLLAVLAAAAMVNQFLFPLALHALTGGPEQPEFASFESVATTSMVNELNGSFSYNLPLLSVPGANGGGYPVSLSYHSGLSMEQEASWVGYGWSLSPGAVSRATRGLPDDYHKGDVKVWSRTPAHWTVSGGMSKGFEKFSFDEEDRSFFEDIASLPDSYTGRVSLRYNSQKGFGVDAGVSAYVKGIASLGPSISSDRGFGFNYRINPAKFLSFFDDLGKPGAWKDVTSKTWYNASRSLLSSAARYGISSASDPVRQMAVNASTGVSANLELSLVETDQDATKNLPTGPETTLFGNFTYQANRDEAEHTACGYLYSGEAASGTQQMDYMMEKELPYSRRDMFLAIPFSMPDNYIATGEGLSGGFRLHHRTPGHFAAPDQNSPTYFGEIGAGINIPTGTPGVEYVLGSGSNASGGYQNIEVGHWRGNSDDKPYSFRSGAAQATEGDGEPYFFRFQNDMGGTVEFADDDRPAAAGIGGSSGWLTGGLSSHNLKPPSSLYEEMNKGKRSGRSSHIAYSTLEEMLAYKEHDDNGQTQRIYYRSHNKDDASRRHFLSYYENKAGVYTTKEENFLKSIGEFAVTKSDGMRYVYGLPVYSRNEKTLFYGIDMAGNGDVTDDDNLVSHKKVVDMHHPLLPAEPTHGHTELSAVHRDNAPILRGEERNSAYANSYLLTEITSPDFVDRSNDGPTADDFGAWVKFDYRYAMQPHVTGDHNGDEEAAFADLSNKQSSSHRYWYNWRMPYTGLFYQRNTLSEGEDDLGQVSRGEKEIYYMQVIETKSHVAYFITNKTNFTTANGLEIKGSGRERPDAYEASHNEIAALWNPKATVAHHPEYNDAGTRDALADELDGITRNSEQENAPVNKSEMLERIELYAKDDNGNPGRLLKTVHLEYANQTAQMAHLDPASPAPLNELMPFNLPNSSRITEIEGGDMAYGRSIGKLTLSRVWFEYEDIVNARIAPYSFDYHYKLDYPAEVLGTYPTITAGLNELSKNNPGYIWEEDPQNPWYDPANVDCWGYYRRDGGERHRRMRYWVDQNPTASFDPAAWHLKQIRLPSGGEIHVQYEQHDYNYVQDKRAMAMVSLVNAPPDAPTLTDRQFYLDVGPELGIPLSGDLTDAQANPELHRFKDFLRAYYDFDANGDHREKMYFKYLYALEDGESPTLDRNSGHSEYIDGYAHVDDVGINQYGLYIIIGTSHDELTWPKRICGEYVKTHRRGSAGEEAAGFDQIVSNAAGRLAEGAIREMVERLFEVSGDLFGDPECYEMNFADSFLRVPLAQPKKGGGVRVKRLLMYDEGMAGEGAALYGNEYIYRTKDEFNQLVSSGVATNEPAMIREENALVNVYKRRTDDNGFWQRIFSGEDRQQFEGPIGETLLPGPSIAYSRVIVSNIHNAVTGGAREAGQPGQTTTGFSVFDFNTVKDYPLSAGVQRSGIDRKSWEPLPIVTPIGSLTINQLFATQGYSFVLHEMHGQPKRVASYAGSYGDYLADAEAGPGGDWTPSSLVEYSYFEPDESIQVLDGLTQPLREYYPGKEMEVVMASKSISDITIDGNVEWDANLVFRPPPLLPTVVGSVGPSGHYNEALLKTHVTTKIVRYPALVKSVKTFRDGRASLAENVAFDAGTGQPAIVRTTDGFHGLDLAAKPGVAHDGSYYVYSVPAADHYDAMGAKALNERSLLRSGDVCDLVLTLKHDGSYYIDVSALAPNCVCDYLSRLGPGDMIELRESAGPAATSQGLYHIAQLDGQRIDLLENYYGAPPAPGSLTPDGIEVNIEVLRSGSTNQLAVPAGSISTYGDNPMLDYPLLLQQRQRVVHALNEVLKVGGGSILGSEIPGGQHFSLVDPMQPGGVSCAALPDDASIDISVSPTEVLLEVGRVRSDPIVVPCASHPMVTMLNTLLDSYWGSTVDAAITPLATYPNGQICVPVSGFWLSEYSPGALSGIQATIDQQTATADFNCVLDANDVPSNGLPLSLTLQPTDPRYDFAGPSAYGDAGLSDERLVSLKLMYGTTPLLESWLGSSLSGNYTNANLPWAFHQNTTVSCADRMAAGPFTTTIGYFSQNNDGYLEFTDLTGPGLLPVTYTYDNIRFGTLSYTIVEEPHTSVQLPIACPADVLGNQPGWDRWQKTYVDLNVPPSDARFGLNEDGELIFSKGGNDCCPQPVPMFQFCPDNQREALAETFHNSVLQAGATSFDDNWSYEAYFTADGTPANANVYERGEKGKWRVRATHAFNTAIVGGAQDRNMMPGELLDPLERRVYNNAGVYREFKVFNWRDESANLNTDWLTVSETERYTPSGEALEERNALGIYATAKFGYRHAVPYLVAQNASYGAVQFESFESLYGSPPLLEEDIALPGADPACLSTEYAHSGTQSLILSSACGAAYACGTVAYDPQESARGLVISAWLRLAEMDYEEQPCAPSFTDPCPPIVLDIAEAGISGAEFRRIARSGEWALYEIVVAETAFNGNPAGINPVIKLNPNVNLSSDPAIDDIRIQPVDAQMLCSVYEPGTLRLLAQLDDQNFALRYQYNAQGQLVRKIRETERGLKTFAESHFHVPNIAQEEEFVPSPFDPFDPLGGGTSNNNSGQLLSPPETRPQWHKLNIPPDAAREADGAFDLLQLDVSPDRQRLRLLEDGDVNLPSLSPADSSSLKNMVRPDSLMKPLHQQKRSLQQKLQAADSLRQSAKAQDDGHDR